MVVLLWYISGMMKYYLLVETPVIKFSIVHAIHIKCSAMFCIANN